MGLTPEKLADRLRHQDGGALVREVYGHFDSALSRKRVGEAFRSARRRHCAVRRVVTQSPSGVTHVPVPSCGGRSS